MMVMMINPQNRIRRKITKGKKGRESGKDNIDFSSQ